MGLKCCACKLLCHGTSFSMAGEGIYARTEFGDHALPDAWASLPLETYRIRGGSEKCGSSDRGSFSAISAVWRNHGRHDHYGSGRSDLAMVSGIFNRTHV